jgi:two-component system, LytTR family, response regulator
MNFIKLHYPDGNRVIDTNKIVRIEAKSNYSKIFFNDSSPLIVAKVLHLLQQQLPQAQFARTHKSHLINKNYLIEIVLGKGRVVKLNNGETVPISVRNKMAWV